MPEGWVMRNQARSQQGSWFPTGKNLRLEPDNRLKWESRFYWAEGTSKKSHPTEGAADSPHRRRKTDPNHVWRLSLYLSAVSTEGCWYQEIKSGEHTGINFNLYKVYFVALCFPFMIWANGKIWVSSHSSTLQEFSMSRGSSWSACISGQWSSMSGST